MGRRLCNWSTLVSVLLCLSSRAFATSTSTVAISGTEQSGDSGSITISFTDSLGHVFAETVSYGQFSTSAGIASAFGAMFSNQYLSSGLCSYAAGNQIIFKLNNGATLGSPTITDPSQSFSVTNSSAAPTITTISPNPATTGSAVVIDGVSFGATQGSSTVSFNGVAASPSSWSDTFIVVNVPTGSTSGNVVVTVNGTNSNGVPITITTECTQ